MKKSNFLSFKQQIIQPKYIQYNNELVDGPSLKNADTTGILFNLQHDNFSNKNDKKLQLKKVMVKYLPGKILLVLFSSIISSLVV